MAGDRITLSELEREHILSTLRRCRGNRTHATRSLGISVRGLRINSPPILAWALKCLPLLSTTAVRASWRIPILATRRGPSPAAVVDCRGSTGMSAGSSASPLESFTMPSYAALFRRNL
jgi:hypothetical protein